MISRMNSKKINILLMLIVVGILSLSVGYAFAKENSTSKPHNIIFIHPDGTAQAAFTAARLLHYGPDGTLNWDRLPHVAIYKSHIINSLQSGSVAGAVAHASGIKNQAKLLWFRS